MKEILQQPWLVMTVVTLIQTVTLEFLRRWRPLQDKHKPCEEDKDAT